jgi:hypothetical protein
MYRKHLSMKQLDIRKQLLVAEAEVLRAQMAEDILAIRRGAKTCHRQARSMGAIASAVGLVVAGLNAFRHSKTRGNGATVPKASMVSQLISGARFASGIWSALRSRRH